MRYSHAGSRWWSLAIESRIMWCAFFSRQSHYSNATHALTNARQSFWIMRVHQSPAFSIFFKYFSVRYAIVDGDRQGVTGPEPLSNLGNQRQRSRNARENMKNSENAGWCALKVLNLFKTLSVHLRSTTFAKRTRSITMVQRWSAFASVRLICSYVTRSLTLIAKVWQALRDCHT